MRKGNSGASEYQDAPDPPWWRLIAFWSGVESRIVNDEFHQQQENRGEHESEYRGEQERIADLRRLGPVDTGSAVLTVHQRIGNANADNRTDQRVRAGGRQ